MFTAHKNYKGCKASQTLIVIHCLLSINLQLFCYRLYTSSTWQLLKTPRVLVHLFKFNIRPHFVSLSRIKWIYILYPTRLTSIQPRFIDAWQVLESCFFVSVRGHVLHIPANIFPSILLTSLTARSCTLPVSQFSLFVNLTLSMKIPNRRVNSRFWRKEGWFPLSSLPRILI